MITTLVRPLYSDHSDDARDLKKPGKAVAWYVQQARMEYLRPICSMVQSLADLDSLYDVGFDTSYGDVPPGN
eukprot:11181969-Lingulodinium_polyedra.AAC.1